MYERFKFYNRSQGTNGSIAEFAAGLKACAHSCNFGETFKGNAARQTDMW